MLHDGVMLWHAKMQCCTKMYKSVLCRAGVSDTNVNM